MLNYFMKFFAQRSLIMVRHINSLVHHGGTNIHSRPFDEILFSLDSTTNSSSSPVTKDDYCLDSEINVISLT